ncbi:MAG: outer membrane protein assembly factor BamE [Candidatus Pelagibacterales bacterium]|nr:MAG: outer membrane protein assembly factor BamE [Pelagibacterales bacterium]
MKKIVYLLLILLFTSNCQGEKIVKTHGIAYLEKREKLLIVNTSNKNDVVNIFGQPSTKGMNSDNLWIYIERTMTKGKLLKLGRNYLTKNNVLVLEFNKYGILEKKKLSSLDDMKEIKFAKSITENEIRKQNFVYSFLSSVRQKMENKKK